MNEEEFFDAIDATLDKIDKDDEKVSGATRRRVFRRHRRALLISNGIGADGFESSRSFPQRLTIQKEKTLIPAPATSLDPSHPLYSEVGQGDPRAVLWHRCFYIGKSLNRLVLVG